MGPGFDLAGRVFNGRQFCRGGPIDSAWWRRLTNTDSPKVAIMKLTSFLGTLTLIAATFTAATALAAEPAQPSPLLSAQAKIDRATAEKTALARVPGGHIKQGELEQEHGHLVWSFDIAQAISPNIIEVQVDAINGTVVSRVTETPADQAKEAAQDRATARKSAPK